MMMSHFGKGQSVSPTGKLKPVPDLILFQQTLYLDPT